MNTSLADYLVRAPIEQEVQISASVPFLVDYRDRRRLYIFSLTNLDLNAGEYGTLHVPASVWYELPLMQGTQLTAYNKANNQRIWFKATDEVIPYTDVEAFDLTNLSANANNTPLMPFIDAQYFEMLSLQIYGTWSGTVTFQGSNDDKLVQISSVLAVAAGDTTQTKVTTATTNGIYVIDLPFRYVQAEVTAYSSGPIQAFAEFYRVRRHF